MDTIYKRIIEQINRLNITGTELGKMLGLKKSPLTDWKNQKSNPTLDQVIRMSEIFAISTDYLLLGKNEHPQEKIYNLNEQEMLSGFRTLSKVNQGRCLGYIDGLIALQQQADKEIDATKKKVMEK